MNVFDMLTPPALELNVCCQEIHKHDIIYVDLDSHFWAGMEWSVVLCDTMCCVALCCVVLRCVALRCVALRCVALRCVALRSALL
jgi:hypothetical protein